MDVFFMAWTIARTFWMTIFAMGDDDVDMADDDVGGGSRRRGPSGGRFSKGATTRLTFRRTICVHGDDEVDILADYFWSGGRLGRRCRRSGGQLSGRLGGQWGTL